MILGSHDLLIVCELAAVTFFIGLLIGFVGAGGAGVAVAILTTGFDLPAHTAIGTAIAAMFFVTISGAISHLREGNVALRLGLVVGLSGAAGAILGADKSQAVDDQTLAMAAGLALWGLAVLMWLRTRLTSSIATTREPAWQGESARAPREWLAGIGIGCHGRGRGRVFRRWHGAAIAAWTADRAPPTAASDRRYNDAGSGIH